MWGDIWRNVTRGFRDGSWRLFTCQQMRHQYSTTNARHSTLLAAERERPSNITPPFPPSECSLRRGRFMTARPIEHSDDMRYA